MAALREAFALRVLDRAEQSRAPGVRELYAQRSVGPALGCLL